ncbi:MAG: hypothetical protein FJX23_01130, partial [Alphaproteobacteria bacterium]|nr:hypothetical protein [Alphaproteobacteria bacterium]
MRLLLSTTALCLCFTPSFAQEAPKWQPTLELEGRLNDDRAIAYPKMLIPLAQDEKSLLFADVRGRLDDQSSQEYNLGLGYRQQRAGWIFGGYVFADHLHSANGFDYWQGTAGFEALTGDWDLRINGYLPENEVNSIAGAASIVVDGGGNIGISSTNFTERALRGVDAEIGYRLPIDAFDLRAFGGFYHFDASGFENVSGPKARVEFTVKHEHWDALPEGVEFTFGAQFQNDGPREDMTTALAQIRIPFGGASAQTANLSRLDQRMTNFIERDVDIVAGTGSTAPTVEAAGVYHPVGSFTQVSTVIDADTVDINAALAAAGADSLVLFDGSKGDIDIAADSVITPLDGQLLLGGGAEISVVGLTSGRVVDAPIIGTRPNVTNSAAITGGAMLRIDAIDSGLHGIDFTAGNTVTSGISVENISAAQVVVVTDTHLSGMSTSGLNVTNSVGAQLFNAITIDDTATGVSVDNSFQTLLSDVSVTNATTGIFLDSVDTALMTGITLDAANNGIIGSASDFVVVSDFDITSDVALAFDGLSTLILEDGIARAATYGNGVGVYTNASSDIL